MIIKKVHYVWVGEGRFNATIKKCIKSWKKNLPNYEFKLWTVENAPMHVPFLRQAYDLKAWAFCSDYVRLYALYNEGGIYLDTDMLVIKSIDRLLNADFFIGKEDETFLGGSIIGSIKGHEFIKRCLDYYDNASYDENFHLTNAFPKVITNIYNNYNRNMNLLVLANDYFYPYSYEDSQTDINPLSQITKNTIAIHLWTARWFPDNYKGILFAQRKKIFKAIWFLFKAYFKDPKLVYLKNIKYAISKYFGK